MNETKENYGTKRLIELIFKEYWSRIVRFVFFKGDWLIYEQNVSDIIEKQEKDLIPQLPNFNLKVITNIEDFVGLGNEGIDLDSFPRKTRYYIIEGAIAFCLFLGKDLMHIGWLCLNKKARDSVTPIPYYVDFSKMGCIERSQTMPRYTGGKASSQFRSYKGLLAYCYFKRVQYLHNLNIDIARMAILPQHHASIRIIERFNAKVVSRIRLIKLLFFQDWKEFPSNESK